MYKKLLFQIQNSEICFEVCDLLLNFHVCSKDTIVFLISVRVQNTIKDFAIHL